MKTVQALLSPILCLVLIGYPVAPANAGIFKSKASVHYHEVCDKALEHVKNPSLNNGTGDQLGAECTKAEMTENARKVEKNKTLMFTAAAIVTGILITQESTPWGSPTKLVCIALAAGAIGSGSLLDKSGVSKNKELVGGFAGGVNSAVSTVGSVATAGVGVYSMIKGVAGTAAKTASTSSTTAGSNTGCIVATAALGLMAGVSGSGWAKATSNLKKITQVAQDIKVASQGGASYSLTASGNSNTANNNVNAPNNSPAVGQSCESQNGSGYARCMAGQSPELAAMANSPDFNENMSKIMGKDIGSFMKNFDGESKEDAAGYIANSLGMGAGGATAVAKIMDMQQKLAQDSGFADSYKPGSYVASSKSAADASDHGIDKMMEEMMKQMAGGSEDALGQARDPASEISFRQMELMSPEKIEKSDISLFSRVQYRIQKNSKNLEQMNPRSDQVQAH